VKEHETVVLPWGTSLWYNRGPEEIEAQRREDTLTGNTLTSDGESRLYSPIGYRVLRHNALAIITRKRGLEWNGFRTKPKHLVEGLVTLDGIPQLVMFSYGPNEKKYQTTLQNTLPTDERDE
jgi:hypothetical protein